MQQRGTRKWTRGIACALAAGPLVFPSCLMTLWLVACAKLGHTPRMYIDDPSRLGLQAVVLYWLTLGAMASAPGAALFAIVGCPVWLKLRGEPWRTGLALGVLSVVIGWGSLAIAPASADWWFD